MQILYVSSYYFFCFLFSHLKMWTTHAYLVFNNTSILNSYLIHTQTWFVIAVCVYFSSWRWVFNWLYDEKLGEQGHRCKLLSCNLACHLILVLAALFTPVCSLSRLGPDIHLRRRKSVLENIRCYFFVKLCLIFNHFCLLSLNQGKLTIPLSCTPLLLHNITMSHVSWSANMLEIH